MMTADEIAEEAAASASPLRYFCMAAAAEACEMAMAGASCDAIEAHLDAVCTAAEKRIVAEPFLISWSVNEPTIQ